jgi:modification methylase
MKAFNNGKQMRSDWYLPICSGSERLQVDGQKAHSTQKPEALLYRIILSTTNPGDLVLDPFFGSGTTGAVAKKLHRHWIGIERELKYVQIARRRIAQTPQEPFEELIFDVRDKRRLAPRVAFATLLEQGLLRPGQKLYFQGKRNAAAYVKPDGKLYLEDGFEGSIHKAGRHLVNGSPCNGWDHWYFAGEDGELHPIDDLRQKVRARLEQPPGSL